LALGCNRLAEPPALHQRERRERDRTAIPSGASGPRRRHRRAAAQWIPSGAATRRARATVPGGGGGDREQRLDDRGRFWATPSTARTLAIVVV
jgi:hypothetical protein